MNLSAIYLDASELIQTDFDGEGLDNRQNFLKPALASPVGTSQFLVTNNQRHMLENLGLLPASSNFEIVNPVQKTAGAIASALLPFDRIDDSTAVGLIPTNSLVAHNNLLNFMQAMLSSEHDAGVLLVESQNPNFSYVRMFEGKIIEFVEKRVVGNYATTGVFFFRNKDILVNCARWAIVNNQTTNDQFYVAPSLNYLLTSGRSIGFQVLTEDQYQHFSFPTEKGQ